jgi:hypothetical protein
MARYFLHLRDHCDEALDREGHEMAGMKAVGILPEAA